MRHGDSDSASGAAASSRAWAGNGEHGQHGGGGAGKQGCVAWGDATRGDGCTASEAAASSCGAWAGTCK